MENFPSNSQNPLGKAVPKAKPAEKKVEAVVTGEVIQKPKTLGRRFKDLFVASEFKGAAQYITREVMLPALKNLVVDATSKGIERVIYGDASPRRARTTAQPGPRVTYNNPINRSAMLPHQPPYVTKRRSVGEVVLASRQDAENVIEGLQLLLETYDVASIADFNELCNLQPTPIDYMWGWESLTYYDIRQTRDGWVIDLPPPVSL